MSKNQSIKLSSSTSLTVPQKFTIDQWSFNNQEGFRKFYTQCQRVENLIGESERICDATLENTKTNKTKTDHELQEKVEDLKFIKGELLQHHKHVILEIDALKVYKARLIDALASVNENSSEICRECINMREHRIGIDLTIDEVEKELKKELETITRVEDIFRNTIKCTNEQIRLLKSKLYYLAEILDNKDISIHLDEQNLNLQETSYNLKLYKDGAPFDPSYSTTAEECNLHTDEVIMSTMKQLNSAKLLRNYIDSILKEAVDDLNKRKNTTNDAFSMRIQETKQVKASLEEQHAEVIKQANAMTQNVMRLEKSITEKEGFLALAHTRLGNRCHRPNLDLTRDQVEKQLVVEFANLRESVAILQRTLHEAQATLRNLLKVQINLEAEINVKMNTLKIDEVDCMTLRQKINYHIY